MAMTEEELNEMRELLMAYRQQKEVKKRGKKSKRAIAPQDDYENMSLAEFSGQLNDSMSDCIELGINEFFDMERESKKGNKLKAVSHGIKGSVAVGLVGYGLVELFITAMGGRD